MMGAHPQTLYGLADSPAPLRMDDRPRRGELCAHRKSLSTGCPYGSSDADDILDNITLSWLTNTGMSSARLYTELQGGFIHDLDISVPAAVSVFPEEVFQAPRSWAERAFRNLLHFNELPQGGHFAAWEQPGLFVQELRAGLRSLR